MPNAWKIGLGAGLILLGVYLIFKYQQNIISVVSGIITIGFGLTLLASKDKSEIEKNRLDLAYQRNLQLLNTALLIGSGSFVTYLVALILDISKAFQYTIILVILAMVTYIFYNRVNDNLKKISESIKKLAS